MSLFQENAVQKYPQKNRLTGQIKLKYLSQQCTYFFWDELNISHGSHLVIIENDGGFFGLSSGETLNDLYMTQIFYE